MQLLYAVLLARLLLARIEERVWRVLFSLSQQVLDSIHSVEPCEPRRSHYLLCAGNVMHAMYEVQNCRSRV